MQLLYENANYFLLNYWTRENRNLVERMYFSSRSRKQEVLQFADKVREAREVLKDKIYKYSE